MTAVTLNLDAVTTLSYDQFWHLALANRDARLELTAQGQLVVMPPTGWESGKQNMKLGSRLNIWAEADGTGIAFDSSTGFILPNGAIRSPDAAWVRKDRLEALNPDPEKFLPLAPDFVIELRSATDALKGIQDKMKEYQKNGVRLGWLLNPKDCEVSIYRPDRDVEVLCWQHLCVNEATLKDLENSPPSLSGEDVLPGFVLDLKEVFGVSA
ncbi:Uma2 family endonuclease [Synechococcales cyanobacterium C]|uniref:Uma2 family endonuclease n=1 Tax=Petrachloros mirabilis ULC683 TaxID=2781853 RepID=A0A8K2A1J1_9CYAN|nr:Uma2 family endonuclease [Petrachloros mirabilis]NCJ08071.1 Uma2 family endonuclease [Petrachloros mirabilis ULC683]